MKTMKFTCILLFFIILSGTKPSTAQVILSPEEAIRIGLLNNFDIRLVRQEVAEAENNLSLGNAGFLPQLDLTASQNYSVTDSKQLYLSGTENDRKGATSDALNAGVQLSWTIFDGLRMFVQYDRLREIQEKTELSFLLTVEYAVQQILSNYYNLINLNQQIRVVEKTILVDLERLKLTEDMLEIGSGSRLDLLQAQVDLNADSAMLLRLQDQVLQTKSIVNQLLARDSKTSFSVQDTFVIQSALNFDVLAQKMLAQNTSLRLTQQDERLSLLLLKEIRGRQIPSLGLNIGYNFLDQQSQSGFLLSNRSLGLTYGIQASMNLFDGFNRSREKRNAAIQIESSRIRTESVIRELENELSRNFDSYLNKMKLVAMEKQNLGAAGENLSIAGERYRLGDLSGFEFREAQRNYMTTEGRMLQVQFETKLLEMNLLQLSGELVLGYDL